MLIQTQPVAEQEPRINPLEAQKKSADFFPHFLHYFGEKYAGLR